MQKQKELSITGCHSDRWKALKAWFSELVFVWGLNADCLHPLKIAMQG